MAEKTQEKPKAKDFKNTTIKIISGVMRGAEIPVRKPMITMGRSSDSEIQVHDTMMSRVHCRFEWEDGRWYLYDLDSTNGTWMVGRKVDKRVFLPLKTSVRIGNTIFELIDVFADDTESFSRPFIAFTIQPETLALSTPTPGQIEEKQSPHTQKEENQRLSSVYKFQNMIASVLDEKELYTKILGAVANVFSTDKTFLMLYDLDSGEFTPVGGRDSSGALKKIDKRQIKSSVVKFVRENKESVLSIDDSFEKQRFQELKNVPHVQTSTMCVPMLGKRQINGMIYLSLSSTTEKYTEDDLRLLTVLGHTAGMAVENSRLVQFNLKNERLVATGTTAAGLSHYIKNILAGLDGSLNLLKMGIEDQDFKLTAEAASILNKNHKRLADLVLDLLNLASEQKPDFTIYDINLVISDVIELIKPQLSEQGITISMDSALKDSPFLVEMDAKGIHRVLLNLITNAEQAIISKHESSAHKGNILVTSKLNAHNDYALITVSDDGIGLEKKEITAMFDLFVTSKGSAGTGLGLAVSKRIINAHDGNVTATSDKGDGCTVGFSLPVSHNDTTTTTRTISKVKR